MEAVDAQNRTDTDGRFEHLEDERLISYYLEHGDDRAFEELYNRYAPRLVSHYWSKLDSKEDAEELVQVVWTRVYRHMHKFDQERGEFATWLWTIANRLLWNSYRDRDRDPQVTFSTLEKNHGPDAKPLQFEDESRLPDDQLAKRETREVLRAAVQRLPPKKQEALELRMFEGKSYREMADELGKTVGTVKSRLHRARDALPQVLVEKLRERGHATSLRVLPDDLEDALHDGAGETEEADDVEDRQDLSPDAVASFIEELNEQPEEDEDDGLEIVPGETTARRHAKEVAHLVTDQQDGRLYVACGAITPAPGEAELDDAWAPLCGRCERFSDLGSDEDDEDWPDRAAFTEEEAREIHRRVEEELPPVGQGRYAYYDELADEYDASRSTIKKLIRGESVYSRLQLPNLLEEERDAG